MNHQKLRVPASFQGPQGVIIAPPHKNKRLRFTITVRRTYPELSIMKELSENLSDNLRDRSYISHDDAEELFGITTEDRKALDLFYKEFKLKCEDINPLIRTIELSGKVQDIEQCFSTKISIYQNHQGHRFYSYQGYLSLPVSIFHIISKIDGLSPASDRQFRVPMRMDSFGSISESKTSGYLANRISKAYNFPDGITGQGQCIAIIECGGTFNTDDFDKFCTLAKIEKPTVISKGRKPKINDKNRDAFNAEATLDTQILAAVAPGAKMVIYNAPTILEGMQMIINDNHDKPDIVSISWAIPESMHYSSLDELNHLLQLASMMGITVIAASGDHGAIWNSKIPDVAFPSSNPYVLGCGGTILKLENDAIASEVVWNELNKTCSTGGGFSKFYSLPGYQRAALSRSPYFQTQGRAVPDVAADASVQYGYEVIYNGVTVTEGGTSGATPLWAGLIALLNEKIGKNLGFANPLFYKLIGTKAFRPILHGNNNHYSAGPGWNPCTGLGTPNGTELLQELLKLMTEEDE